LNRRRIIFLVLAAAVGFCLTAAIPVGRPSLRVELNARVTDDSGPGTIAWAVGDEPFTSQSSLPLKPVTKRFQLQVVELPAADPAACRLAIEPLGREGAALFLRDLRITCRSGLLTRLWSIDPARLAPSERLELHQVKPGLWRLSAPEGVPLISLDLAGLEPLSFLRAETAAWFLFWAALVLLTIGLSRAAEPIPPARLLIYAAALLLIAVQGWGTMRTVPYGSPPDEIAHVSYLTHLEEGGRIFPDYHGRFLYSEQGTELDHRNYLAHPPFYYDLLKPFVPRGPRLIVSRLHDLRLVNLALALCGVALFFWIGCREPLPLAFHAYYAAALSAVPMVSYLAGSVNNDNLLLIAGGLAVYGAVLFLQPEPRPAGLVLLGAGLSLALLVKATAGVQLFFLVGLVLTLRVIRDRSTSAFRGFHLPVFILLCLVPAAYYLWAYAAYHTFIPQFGATWYELPERPVTLSPLLFVRRFFRVLYLSWTGILSHQSLFRVSLVSALPLLLPLGLAAWGLLLGEQTEKRPFFAVHRRALVSLLLLMVFHFTMVYRYHLSSGYPGGMQARYYFPLMPCVLMLSFRPFANSLHRPVARICLALLAAGLLASGIWFYWFRLL
jgi:hypothetical protein